MGISRVIDQICAAFRPFGQVEAGPMTHHAGIRPRVCIPARSEPHSHLVSLSSFSAGIRRIWKKPAVRRWLPVAVVLVLLISGGAYWLSSWSFLGHIEPRGGLPFIKRVELPVPSFRQSDPAWAEDPLGPSDDTLSSAGCAVASAAMVLNSYGIDTDPKRLNQFLIETEGYTPEGWIYWEKAAEMASDVVRHVYEDLPSYRLIDTNLMKGNPVIVRLRQPSGITHFVVIAGKDGFDYLTRDPGAGAKKGLYALKEYGSKIEALRFYEKLK